MIQAIENMNEFYRQKHIDFMHQATSLPGVTMRVRFNSTPILRQNFISLTKRIKIFISCLNRTSLMDPVSFSIVTMKLVKVSFETIRTNLVRKSSAMMQMRFIFGP